MQKDHEKAMLDLQRCGILYRAHLRGWRMSIIKGKPKISLNLKVC